MPEARHLHGSAPDTSAVALLLIDWINDLEFDGGERLLPRALPEPETEAVAAAGTEHTSLKGLRVLLVEDDPSLNELVGQMLEEQGSQVLAAATAAEGLALFEANPVDAVLSDMVMPSEMGGLDLARRMRELREDFPVVLMTGYSAAAGPAAAEGFAVLRKPFTMATLATTLENSLRNR